MKTLRRLFYGEMVLAVALVTLGFVALFYFLTLLKSYSPSPGIVLQATKSRRR